MIKQKNVSYDYTICDFLSLVYLGLPVFIFFACFAKVWIGFSAIIILSYILYKIIKRTQWKLDGNIKLLFLVFAISSIWVLLSGGLFGVSQNYDWVKHNAILNVLSHNSWPVNTENGNMRYYLGWYLTPALVMKLFNGNGGILISSIWSLIGVVLFFWGVISNIKSKLNASIVILTFIFFSGADNVGYLITKFQVDLPLHFEWWAGWIEYASNTTSLFWVQQHAIPGWIGITILLKRLDSNNLQGGLLAMLLIFIAFWSPFVAVGLLPFVLPILSRFGLYKSIVNIENIIVSVVVGLPIVLYLLSNTGEIISGPIWSNRCTIIQNAPCFTISSFFLFLALEIGGAVLVMLTCKTNIPKSFLIISVVSLCLIPLYKVGPLNDFAMRASIPGIAVLALACGKALVYTNWPKKLIPLLVVLIGIGIPLGEMYRGIFILKTDFEKATIKDLTGGNEIFLQQYFTEKSIWVLRDSK
ncbi:Uncharacterised protein [Yersinia rohdei]|uniref:hypothetical protein n=1 Tax=Yersinia rohdei TaxID=29485 RepID=UPI00061C29B4|nr:hypothetical protein [Yersinia rohdei]CNE52500.1 Uncharacterised protein [Yersinia rohdei]